MKARRKLIGGIGRTKRQNMGYFDLSRCFCRDRFSCRTFRSTDNRFIGRAFCRLFSRAVRRNRFLNGSLFFVRIGGRGRQAVFCRSLWGHGALRLLLWMLGKLSNARLWAGG
jgi:hypothetical protein